MHIKNLGDVIMTVIVNGVKFQLLNWDFYEDDDMGSIYFLVPKGTYKYINGGNNGAVVWDYPENPLYDRASASCSCFDVNGKSEKSFGSCLLTDIVQASAEFIDINIPRN